MILYKSFTVEREVHSFIRDKNVNKIVSFIKGNLTISMDPSLKINLQNSPCT